MKRLVVFFLLLLILTGCGKTDHMAAALSLREKMNGSGCAFKAEITADYGQEMQSFILQNEYDGKGNVSFTVLEPAEISGITGRLAKDGGNLTFDDRAVYFPMLAEERLSPVAAPWVMVHTLCSGYISACGEESGEIRLTIMDSYEEKALRLDIWLDEQEQPKYCEISWEGQKILSMTVEAFSFL